MKDNLSQNNQSFGYLHNSSEFLNLIINEITSCVILLDREMNLHAFNEPFKALFSPEVNESMLYKKCGNVIGCSYAVEENKECGQTSECNTCSIRESALISYMNNTPIYKDLLSRDFYINGNKKIKKHLQFSTRLFYYKMDKYIVIILNDITDLTTQQILIKEQAGLIIEMSKN